MIDINPIHLETVTRILAAHVPECEVRAFGSRVTWTAKDYSDLDLAVVGGHALDPDVLRRLREAFEESDLPFRVDVLDWHAISAAFQKVIEGKFEVVQKGHRKNSGVLSEWRVATVAELQREGVLLVEDGNHGEYRPRPDEFSDEGVAFIRAADMDGGRVLFGTASRINERAHQRITKGIGAPGDVLLSHKGTVGKIALVLQDAPPFVCSPQTTFWRSLDPKTLDRDYLYAFLRSPGFHRQLATRAGETDMAPYVSLTSQRSLSVTLPPIHVQQTIAHILGTLDDKIELNRRINETLEVMARALFKSWFVDFGPVRAKAEGRDPGLAQPLAELFPDSFEGSELGEIPKGWAVGPLDSVLVLQRGFDLPTTHRTSGAYPVLAASGPSGTHNKFMARGPCVTTGRSGVLGKVFYVQDDFWPLNTSLWVKEFRHSRPAYAFHFLLGIDLALFNAGSAVPTLNRNHVHNLPSLRPPMSLIDEFERIAAESLDCQKHNDDQSRTLAALRDMLLPKLISGELRPSTGAKS